MQSSFPVLCAAALALAGCGGGPAAKKSDALPVSGKVTFKGAPVTEGVISFENRTAGKGGSGQIGADGSYKADVPPGEMVVTVNPSTTTVPDGPDGPGGEVPKAMPNIPPIYRSALSSPLKATVSDAAKTHNFDMAEQPAGKK